MHVKARASNTLSVKCDSGFWTTRICVRVCATVNFKNAENSSALNYVYYTYLHHGKYTVSIVFICTVYFFS